VNAYLGSRSVGIAGAIGVRSPKQIGPAALRELHAAAAPDSYSPTGSPKSPSPRGPSRHPSATAFWIADLRLQITEPEQRIARRRFAVGRHRPADFRRPCAVDRTPRAGKMVRVQIRGAEPAPAAFGTVLPDVKRGQVILGLPTRLSIGRIPMRADASSATRQRRETLVPGP